MHLLVDFCGISQQDLPDVLSDDFDLPEYPSL